MRRARRDPTAELLKAIEELEVKTRAAMLDAVRCPATRLIAGGYVDGGRGVCPLLAAHRRGGRTHDASSGCSAFAGAWDRYTRTRTGEPRTLAEDERRALEVMLVESLRGNAQEPSAELVDSTSVPEAEGLETGRRERRARRDQVERAGGLGVPKEDADRTPELSPHAGWAWLGVFRTYDDYRAALLAAGEGGSWPTRNEEQHVPTGV